jgi:hypothetical protein
MADSGNAGKEPYLVGMTDASPLPLAGLWER